MVMTYRVRVHVRLGWRSLLRLWLCPRWARHLIRDFIQVEVERERARLPEGEVMRHG